MQFIGIGLDIVIAIFFAVHVVRSGQNIYWLFILFMFPLLGSLVYFVAVYLPDSRLQQGARKAVASAARALNPTRELREARAAFDFTPTAQNRIRLADALLDSGDAKEASVNYEACMTGLFADDLYIRFSAARAHYECQQYDKALEHLDYLRAKDPNFLGEQVSILRARVLAESARQSEAKAEFEEAINRFGSFESKVEYLIWALSTNEAATAGRLQAEIQRTTDRWNRHTKDLNRHLLRRLDAAYQLARKRP